MDLRVPGRASTPPTRTAATPACRGRRATSRCTTPPTARWWSDPLPTSPRAAFAAGIVGALLAAVTGCSGSAPDAGRSGPESGPRASAATTSVTVGRLQVAASRSVRLAAGALASLPVLNSAGVGYVVDGADRQHLNWVDLASGATATLASPRRPWVVDQLSASDQWLVWVERDVEEPTPMQDVNWRIYARDFATGHTRLLLRSRIHSPVTAGIRVSGHTLVYDVYRGLQERSTDIWTMDLVSGARRLVAGTVHSAGYVDTGEDGVVLALSRNITRASAKTDLYLVRPDGSERRLTDSADVADPQFADGRLLYRHTNINHRDTVVVQDWPDGAPRTLFTQDDAGPSLGNGFVSDFALTRQGTYVPVVRPLDDPGQVLRLATPPGLEMDGYPVSFEDKTAWVSFPDGDPGAAGGEVTVVSLALN